MLVMIILFKFLIGFTEAQLKVGFYNKVCPAAETVVANVVKDATKSNSQTPAAMLRLHFHDCFVEVLSLSLCLYIYSFAANYYIL